MSDNDDLDAFARLFGATPETPPEGVRPAAGSWGALPSAPAAPAAPAAAGSAGDPLGWLLSDAPATTALPTENPYAATPSSPALSWDATAAFASTSAPAFPASVSGFPTSTAVAEATQVLPTRRSLAAEAARASRDTGRRNLIILGSIGTLVLVLVVVLIVVLVAKNSSSGSPAAFLKQTPSTTPSASSSASSTPSPTATASETPTPTPTPTPTQVRSVAAPAPGPLTVTASLPAQPTCSGNATTNITIAYTSSNAATLNVSSSDGSVNINLTPAASGTIPSVLYKCDGSGESYTLTVYSTAEGVTPVSTTVTPTPAG